MNLDELKIKVSIELEDLNKQLDAITKGIDKALGPKATKKLMKSNHKIVKTESAAINKELNKAFEVDFKKFNTSLRDSMNQAKQVVRQTCREIRNELNAALNVRGSIRVTGKASVSNSYSSRGSSDSSAIIQSSQYTGAMINKAVNEMIKANNANTARIESALRDIASKLDKINTNSNKQSAQANPKGNATHNQNINADAIIETTFKVIDDELQSNVDKAVRNIKAPSIEVPIDVDTSKVDNIEIPDTYESEVQLTVNDNDIQGTINQIINSVDIPELNAPLDLLDNGVQEQINQIIDSVDIPEIVTEVTVEDNGVQYEVNDIVNSVDVPEITINITAEDDDVQSIVDDIADSVDVPELVINLDVEDNDIQNQINQIVRQLRVPELFVQMSLREQSLQNETNKTVREVSVPELITSFIANQEELQEKINNAISGLELIDIPVSFEIDKNKLQSQLNSVVNELRVPEISVPVKVAKPKTKKGNEANKKKPGPIKKEEKTDESSIDISVDITGDDKITAIQDKLKACGSEAKSLKNTFLETFASGGGEGIIKDLEGISKKLDAVVNNNKGLFATAFSTDDKITQNMFESVRSLLNDTKQLFDNTIDELKKKAKDAFDELSMTSDDDLFGEMSEVVDKEIKEIKNKLKNLNMIYTSLFNRTVIGNSFKYDLNVANKALAETHNNIKALKAFIDSLAGSTGIDLDVNAPEQENTTPSLMIDDNESFSDFGSRLNSEIDAVKNNLQHLDMMYSSLFGNEYLGPAFADSVNIANKELEETVNIVEELKNSMQKLNEYAGFQNKFEAPESAGLPIVASDTLNEQFDSIRNDIDDAHKKIVDFNKAISDLFNYLNMPIEAKFSKSIGEVEQLKNAISNLLSMNKFGPGLEGYKKQIEADSKEIEDSIEKIYTSLEGEDAFKSGAAKELEALNEAIRELSGTKPGIELGAMNLLEDLDTHALKEVEKAEAEIAELEARRTLIIAEIEKRFNNLKEELIDIKNMTAEEFDMKFGGDGLEEALAQGRQELIEYRDLFKEFNKDSDIQINVKAVRDCISLIEKLQAKVDKIQASNAKVEKENAPKSEKEKAPKPTKPEGLLALEKEIKLYKDELLDVKALSDEDFELSLGIDNFGDFRLELLKAKKELLEYRKLFKEFNRDNELQFNLSPIRDCISLIDKLQTKMDKIQASKVTPEVEVGESADLSGLDKVKEELDTLCKEVTDTLRAIDFADEIELNLGIDQLTEQLRNLQSVGDINIDLDDLRRDIVLLLENIDKIRSESDEEIIIEVIDDEVVKIVDLLKLLDDIREQYKIKVDVDTSDATQALEKLAEQQEDIRNKFKTSSGVGSGLFSSTPGGPTGGGTGGGGGRRASSGSFTTPPPRPEPNFNAVDTGMDFDAHIRSYNMDKILTQFKELASKIKPILKDLSNKIKDSLKGALSKLASASKTLWGKITSIFRKGAKDSAKATNSLRDTVKGLVRNFLSFYAIWNGAKMAIQSAEGLIQGEQKLTTVMKNRMKATDDSVRAINKLIDAQSQLGVVSKQVQYNASQQLSVFLQSSKALEILIPTMNDLIAQQYGANATLEEGAEVARKIGQAIVEGEFTELQESTGITLSEAEIEKFKSLATEEERAAYLAQILTDRIGNMNEQLANTPYGAITQLKNNFMELLGTVGTLIVTAIKPLVQWLNQIVIACTKAIKAFGEFLGFSFDATSLGITGGGSVGEGVEDTKEGLEDATEAAEKFKGSLMGFDELNILTDNTNKDESKTPTTDGSIAGGGEAFADDEGALDIMSDKMKAFLDEVLEPFKKAWELLGDRWKTAWADLKESFKNFCDSLATFLKSVWENGGKEFVQHLAEIGLACGIAAMEIGGTILDSLAKLWQHLDPETNMNTQGFIDALNIVSVKLRDLILSLNGFFESLMNNGGQEALNAFGDMLMNLGEAAVRGTGVAIDAISGLLTHLDASTNENTVNLLGAWTEMFGAIGQAALDFVTLLESTLVNGGQEVLNAFADMTLNLAQSVSEIITTIMTAFSGLFEHLDPATNQITQNMLTYWQNAFTAIGEAALGFSELLESTLGNGGQEVINALGDAFASLVGLTGTIVEEIAQAFDALFEHLDPKTNEFTQSMLTAWQTAFENISQMCATIGETLSSVMDNGGQELLNSLGDLVVQISGTFGQLVGIVADSMSKFFEHMDPGKNSASKGAIDALTYAIDSIRGFIDVFGESIQYFLDNGGQDFINNLGDIIALIADLGLTIAGDIISSITAFFDSWAGHIVIAACGEALEIVSTALEALLELLEPFTPLLSGLLAGFAAFKVSLPIIGFITKLVAGFKTLAGAGGIIAVAKTALSGLWAILAANPIAATVAAIVGIGVALVACYEKFEWFRTIIDTVFGPLNKAFEAIVDTVIKVFDDVVDICRNIIDIVVGIFTGDGQKVGNAVRELCGNILKLFGDILVGIVDIGWNIITGLAEGIWNGIKAIPKLLAGIGEFIIDFFKGLFGIHSPSTVFADLGVNLIEGLIQGIEDMISAIGEIFTKIGESIFGWIKDIVDNAIEKWSKLGEWIGGNLSELKENISEKWSNIKETVSTKCKDIYEDTKEKWTNIKDKTVEIASNLKEKAVERYTELKDKLTDAADKWRQNSEEKWNKIKDKTNEITTNIKDTVQERYSKFKDTLTDTMDKWRQNSEEKWTKVKNKTSELVSNLKQDIEDRYTKFKDKLTDTMEKWRSNSEEKWNKIKNKTSELVSNLKSDAETKYNTMKENLTSKLESWRSTSESKWNDIKEKGSNAIENLRKAGEEKFESLKTSIISKMDTIKSDLISKWETVKSKTSEIVSNLKSDVETKYNDLKTNLGTKLEEVKSEASAKWESIKTTTSTKVREVVDEATKKYGEIKESFTKKMDEVKSALGPKWTELKNSVKTNAQGIGSKVSEGLSDVKKKFTKPFEDAKKAVGDVISSIGRTFKNADWSFPKIKLPHIKITGEWSFNPPRVPSFGIEWRKRGGIIDGITPIGFANGALQMGGEAGKEMVVPLENTSFTSKIAQAMGQAVDNAMARNMNSMYGSSANNSNDSKDIVLKVNERELARAAINSINKLQRESGRTLLDI